MDLSIRGRNLELSEPLRAAAQEKVTRLSRFLDGVEQAEIQFYEERNPRISEREVCEVTLRAHSHLIRAKAASSDAVAALDRAVAKTGHLVGSTFTLADMNALPMLFYLHHLPESGAMLRRNAGLAAYYERHMARPSVREAVPPPFPGRSSWTVEA